MLKNKKIKERKIKGCDTGLELLHKDWCAKISGEKCNCFPILSYRERKLEYKNWHIIEGPNGMCACGMEKGVCNVRLRKYIENIREEYRWQLRHEMNEANVLAEFIRKKDLCEEYVKWSRPKFKRLDKSNGKPSNK